MCNVHAIGLVCSLFRNYDIQFGNGFYEVGTYRRTPNKTVSYAIQYFMWLFFRTNAFKSDLMKACVIMQGNNALVSVEAIVHWPQINSYSFRSPLSLSFSRKGHLHRYCWAPRPNSLSLSRRPTMSHAVCWMSFGNCYALWDVPALPIVVGNFPPSYIQPHSTTMH